MKRKYDSDFMSIVKPIIDNENVLEMKKYKQHGNTDCYEHCLNVAYYSYKMAKKLRLDYVSIVRAAMLHDFFLYDWRNHSHAPGLLNKHAFTHGKEAFKNASNLFSLNPKEKDIIENHMWPVTIKLPRYKETYIVTIADKLSAVVEMVHYYKEEFRHARN